MQDVVSLGKAVEKEDRWAGAGTDAVDGDFGRDLSVEFFETWE